MWGFNVCDDKWWELGKDKIVRGNSFEKLKETLISNKAEKKDTVYKFCRDRDFAEFISITIVLSQ